MKDGDVASSPRDLTQADVVEYFSTKLGELTCPVCRQEQFGILFTDRNEYAQLAVASRSHPIADMAIRAVLIECKNCGFIMPFSYQHIREWLDKRSGGMGDEQV